MRRAAAAAAAWAALGGCGGFPEGFYADCSDGGQAACRAPYTCLRAPELTRPGDDDAGVQACTTTCAQTADCPSVFTSHCGEQRACVRGVCTYGLCR